MPVLCARQYGEDKTIYTVHYLHLSTCLSGRDCNLRYKIIKAVDIHLLEPYKNPNVSNYNSWASFP